MSVLGLVLAISASILAAVAILLGVVLVQAAPPYLTDPARRTKLFAFATGVFFSAVLLDFLPDAWEAPLAGTKWGIFLGALLLWGLTTLCNSFFDRFQLPAPNEGGRSGLTQAGALVLAISLSFHTFLEGSSLPLMLKEVNLDSISYLAALLLHKLPEGFLWGMAILEFSPSQGDQARKRLLPLLLVPALVTVIGTLAGVFLVGAASLPVLHFLSALLAGALIFICFSELLPALVEQPYPKAAWFLYGSAVIVLLTGCQLFLGAD